MQYVIIFITTANKKEAEKITKALLEGRLIACANIIKNIDSRFWWQRRIEKAKECLLIVKTTRSSIKKLIKIVRTKHSYEVPEIIAIPILGGYKVYLDWVKKEVRR